MHEFTATYRQIPCESEQGIFLREQGILFAEQGTQGRQQGMGGGTGRVLLPQALQPARSSLCAVRPWAGKFIASASFILEPADE
jgi:hypothetical protein